MPVGKKEKIFTLSIHLKIRIVVELVEIQGDKEFGAAKWRTGVAGLNGMHHSQYIPAQLCADFLELFN
ncbi:hypothetical protein GCM10027164_13250 [Algoriphagus taiwanensis]